VEKRRSSFGPIQSYALFDGQEVELTASFAATPVTLLGREDFFARYRVTIDQREQSFLLEAYEESG